MFKPVITSSRVPLQAEARQRSASFYYRARLCAESMRFALNPLGTCYLVPATLYLLPCTCYLVRTSHLAPPGASGDALATLLLRSGDALATTLMLLGCCSPLVLLGCSWCSSDAARLWCSSNAPRGAPRMLHWCSSAVLLECSPGAPRMLLCSSRAPRMLLDVLLECSSGAPRMLLDPGAPRMLLDSGAPRMLLWRSWDAPLLLCSSNAPRGAPAVTFSRLSFLTSLHPAVPPVY